MSRPSKSFIFFSKTNNITISCIKEMRLCMIIKLETIIINQQGRNRVVNHKSDQ